MKHRVQVWLRTYEVTVEQQSKSVWIACGEYEGQAISVTDRTSTSALKRWREAAHYKGNL